MQIQISSNRHQSVPIAVLPYQQFYMMPFIIAEISFSPIWHEEGLPYTTTIAARYVNFRFRLKENLQTVLRVELFGATPLFTLEFPITGPPDGVWENSEEVSLTLSQPLGPPGTFITSYIISSSTASTAQWLELTAPAETSQDSRVIVVQPINDPIPINGTSVWLAYKAELAVDGRMNAHLPTPIL